jgi:DNA-binding FadR family transcriptional regulator
MLNFQDDTATTEPVAQGAKLSAGIYERILELIVTGDFSLNSRLPSETELARRFGASRPVVREALARLREDGIVVSRQGSGSYVVKRPDQSALRFVPIGSLADIQRCYEFRAGLEGAAAALAAERWQERDMAAIRAALDDLEACVRSGRLGVDEDARFHTVIAAATHNQYHQSVQASLAPHISLGMNLSRNLTLLHTQARLRKVQDEHVAVVDAIAAREPDAARTAMETHIRNAHRRMFEGGV